MTKGGDFVNHPYAETNTTNYYLATLAYIILGIIILVIEDFSGIFDSVSDSTLNLTIAICISLYVLFYPVNSYVQNKITNRKIRNDQKYHSQIENALIAFASKNNGIIMKNELTEISDNKYPNKDLLKAIDKMREGGIVENQGDSYVFTSLI